MLLYFACLRYTDGLDRMTIKQLPGVFDPSSTLLFASRYEVITMVRMRGRWLRLSRSGAYGSEKPLEFSKSYCGFHVIYNFMPANFGRFSRTI